MNPAPFFVLQFVWSLAAWSVIAAFFVRPWFRGLAPLDALAFCTIPQMFRVLGVGLLVSNLAPGMPRSFAVPTAIGDSLTSVLALSAVVALRSGWPSARKLAWACHVVGAADLAIALPHAAHIGAAHYMTAQWYVPAVGVPLMIVSHVLAIRLLLELRRGRRER